MVRKLSDEQEAEIITRLINGASQTALAREYNVARSTIANVKRRNPEMCQYVTQKKEENVKSILAHMDELKDNVCELIDVMLEYMRDEEKLAKAPLNQIATAMGILIDKFTATEHKEDKEDGENNLLEAIAGCVREGDFDDISELQRQAEESGDVVEE